MTSAATRKNLSSNCLGQVIRNESAIPQLPARRGFTLLELILALSVLGVLSYVAVVNLSGWSESHRLSEGARRFETLLHMGRADAANLGKNLQVAFEETETQPTRVQLLWEPDPLGDPQRFVPYLGCTWNHYIPVGLVEVRSCELLGPHEYQLTEDESLEDEDSPSGPLSSLTFYPDGSCDSARIELISTARTDHRIAVIEIDGLTGTITREILTSSELYERTE